MWLTLVAVLAMGVSDIFDVVQTIAEARNRPWLAGGSNAVNNTLSLFVGILGADTLITHGWKQAAVLGVLVFATNFLCTSLTAKWATGRVGSGT